MATLTLRIDGLERGEEARLERAVRELPGVFGVVVSVSEGCAEVDFEDDEIGVDRIVERIRASGYEARMIG